MNAITTKTQTAVSESVLDKPVQMREAWRLLQADFSNQKDITPDKWRLLAVAFESVPDDLLTRAVLNYLAKEPPVFFPRVSDLAEMVRQLKQPTPFEVFCKKMANLGYRMIDESTEDNFTVNTFTDGVNVGTVYR